jgi:hypothetical protein
MQRPDVKLPECQLSACPLSKWQAMVQENILSPTTEHKNKILPWLRQGGACAETRLGVYIDAYVLRLLEALRTNYPVIHQLLGDDYFDVMACRYLKIYPPQHASIRWFGHHLSDFLKKETPYMNVPSLAELADFEWALRHTIDAADINLVTSEYLQSLAPETWGELAFHLHPSLTILKLDWNVAQIWSVLSGTLSSTGHSEKNIPEPVLQPGFWLVYRQPDLVSGWRSATPLEVAALESVYHGLNFADLCEEMCNLTDDVESIPMTAATFLRAWVEQGLLSLRPVN